MSASARRLTFGPAPFLQAHRNSQSRNRAESASPCTRCGSLTDLMELVKSAPARTRFSCRDDADCLFTVSFLACMNRWRERDSAELWAQLHGSSPGSAIREIWCSTSTGWPPFSGIGHRSLCQPRSNSDRPQKNDGLSHSSVAIAQPEFRLVPP